MSTNDLSGIDDSGFDNACFSGAVLLAHGLEDLARVIVEQGREGADAHPPEGIDQASTLTSIRLFPETPGHNLGHQGHVKRVFNGRLEALISTFDTKRAGLFHDSEEALLKPFDDCARSLSSGRPRGCRRPTTQENQYGKKYDAAWHAVSFLSGCDHNNTLDSQIDSDNDRVRPLLSQFLA